MKRSASNLIIILLLVVIIVGVIVYASDKQLAPSYAPADGSASGDASLPAGVAGLVLSELMVENDGAVRDEDGDYPRWVELYNSTSAELSLSGYSLSDRENDATKYPLPAITLAPGEYRVVFLSGKNRTAADGNLHTGFKVNGSETLYLFSGSTIVDSVSGAATSSNISKIKVGSAWEETELYSPGFENTEAGHEAYLDVWDKRDESALKINEVQSSNATTLADEQGLYPDWIEIVNTGTETIDLSGYGLSDDVNKPMEWTFPAMSIGPGERVVVFADGTNNLEAEIPHANFSISSGGETLSLYDAEGYLLDRVTVPELETDTSYARSPDATGDFVVEQTPTPNMENTVESQTTLSNRFFQEHNQGVYISEVMTRNATTLEINSQTPDWVEVTNASGAAVNLAGYRLTNKANATARYTFPDVTLENGESTVVYLTGAEIDLGEEYAAQSADFKGSSTGEMLYLYDADKNVVDKVSVPALATDVSYGRDEGRTSFFYYDEATPGAANTTTAYLGVCEEPAFSDEGGVKTSSLELTLTAPEGSTIYYTTDCSTPTTASTPYTGPISIAENTVVRAIAVRDGYLTSTTATRTYITEDTHTVRVVSLVTDDKYLFSDEMGMYADGPNWQEKSPHGSPGVGANFWMDWEYPVHVEVWEADGTRLIEQDGSFKLNGQYSRALDQKSFAVYARSEYGDEDRFYAPLFSDREYTDYKSFVLRCTGQDYNRSRMRDAMITGTMEGQDVMYQETEVCVLYLNGEYWGHYNMRERVNKWSVAQWEGVTDESVIDNIDLLKGNGNRANRVLNGDNTEYRELIDFCRNNSLTDPENLKYVTDRVDVQNYFDYQIAEIFWANSDNGNIKYYKVPGGKWKWILYDMDWAMNNNEKMPVSWNTFNHVFDPNGTGVSNGFETVLSTSLLENDDMRDLFLERLSYYMTEVFTTDKMTAAIEELYETMKPEMEKHFERWPDHGSVESWERHVERLRTWVQQRPQYVVQGAQEYFDLSDAQVQELFGGIGE